MLGINGLGNVPPANIPVAEDVPREAPAADDVPREAQAAPSVSAEQVAPAVQPDEALQQAAHNGVGPALNAGNGQAVQFAQRHAVTPARDWDMSSARGMLDTAQRALVGIKSFVTGEAALHDYDEQVSTAVADAVDGNPDGDSAELMAAYTEFKQVLARVRALRAALPEGIKDGSECKDVREGLTQILKHMRVFRFEVQKGLQAAGVAGGDMGRAEGIVRGIEHKFTRHVKTLVTNADVAGVIGAEDELLGKIGALRARLQAFSAAAQMPDLPQEAKFADGIAKALELSHLTNNQIRDFQDEDFTPSRIRGIMGAIARDGGSREVTFTAGAGAFVGLKILGTATLGMRAGGRLRVVGDISCPEGGKPISVTFRLAGGAEAEVKADLLSVHEVTGLGVSGAVEGEISRFSTRTYATLDDLILDVSNCRLATADTFLGNVKALAVSVGKLGRKAFCRLTSRADDVKQDNAAYLQTLKDRHVAGAFDELLAKRANPVVLSETTGYTWRVGGGVSGSVSFGPVVDLSGGVSASHAHDFKVVGHSYVPLARVIRDAADDAALDALMRPDPEIGGPAAPVPVYDGPRVAENLARVFNNIISGANALEKNDTVGWAHTAQQVRSLMIATEASARAGNLPREEADRLLARFSNPGTAFPQDVFQEYFMDGTDAKLPSKIRNSFSVYLRANFVTDRFTDAAGTVANEVFKATAEDLLEEAHHQTGLDTTVKYSIVSEKPSHPETVAWPWEKATKTLHELSITASTPARVIIDAITMHKVNKHQRVDGGKAEIAGEIAKDNGLELTKEAIKTGIPALIISSVKPASKALVEKWFSSTSNMRKFVEYVAENSDDAFDVILNAVDWAAKGIFGGSSFEDCVVAAKKNISAESRDKTLKWTRVDGKLDTFAVYTESKKTLGVSFESPGEGLGAAADISYKVSESVRERGYCPHPSLTALLGHAAEHLYLESVRDVGQPANSEAFKNWLASNFGAVEHTLATLDEDKNQELYDTARRNTRDPHLAEELDDALQAAQTLPPDATDDVKLNAVHAFLVKLTTAYLLAERVVARP